MKYLKNIAVLLITAFMLTSCFDEPYETNENGLQYKFFVQNDGEKPQIGDFITINMFYGTDDTVLFDSKRIPDGLTFPLDSPYFKGDLFEGILMMSKGDSASFKMSADSFFLVIARAPTLPEFITPGELMTFEIKLIDFQNKEEKEQADAAVLEDQMLAAEQELNNYITQNNITTEPLESGLIFISEVRGSGRSPNADEMVKVNLSVMLLDGTKIFSTADRGEPFEYQYGQNFDTRGLEEGVGMLKKGGKATLIVPQQIAYGAEARGQMIPAFSTIVYEVELLDIRSKEAYDKEIAEQEAQREAEMEVKKNTEKADRDRYLAENGITVAPTASGLYYIETEKGSGMKAMPGNIVHVHYTGRLLDGTEFDSSVGKDPLSFTLGAGRVIQAWEEAIGMMNEGGKATLVIPSEIGYGASGSGPIPAYATLVFDVELVKVEEAAQ